MYTPDNNEKLVIKEQYEPGDKVMVFGGARGEVQGIIYDNTVPVYSLKIDGVKGMRACQEWQILGAVEKEEFKDVSLKDMRNNPVQFKDNKTSENIEIE